MMLHSLKYICLGCNCWVWY